MPKSSDSTSIVSGSGLILLGTIFELGIAFIAKIFIARFLGTYAYGLVSIGIIILSISTTFVLLGLHHGLARYLPRLTSPESRKGILISAFSITVLTSLIFGSILFFFSEQIAIFIFSNESLSPILKIFAIALPFTAFIRMVVGGLQGIKRASTTVFIKNIILPVSRFTLLIVVLIFGVSAIRVAWAYTLAYAVTALVGIYAIYKYTELFYRVEPAYHFNDLIKFSSPLAISTMMALLFVDADTILLAYFHTASEVGIYAVIFPLSALLIVFLNSFNFLSMPILSELHSQNKLLRMREMYSIVSKWIFIPTFPIFLALFFFPEVLIRFFFGNAYISGSVGLSILSIGFLFNAITGLNETTLLALGKTKYLLFNSTVAGILNIILNILLIPEYSFVGAAIATTVSYVCINLLNSMALYRMTGILPFSKPLIKLGTIATIAASSIYVLFVVLSLNNTGLLLSSILFTFVYFIAIIVSESIGPEEEFLLSHFESLTGVNLNGIRYLIRLFSQ